MTRLIPACAAAVILLAASSAFAEDAPRRHDGAKAAAVAAAVPAYYLYGHAALHEGSHALTGATFGLKVQEFKPYPHLSDRSGERALWFGYTSFDRRPGDGPAALVLAAPYLLDVTMFAAADLWLGAEDSPRSPLAVGLIAVGMAAPWVDMTFNTATGLGRSSDFRGLAESSGLPAWAPTAVGAALSGVGAWRLVVRGRQALAPDKGAPDRPVAWHVLPVATPGYTGLAVTGRF